jgi:hypothetical protein
MAERLRADGSFASENDGLQRHPIDFLLNDAETEPLDGDSNDIDVSYPGLDPDDE